MGSPRVLVADACQRVRGCMGGSHLVYSARGPCTACRAGMENAPPWALEQAGLKDAAPAEAEVVGMPRAGANFGQEVSQERIQAAAAESGVDLDEDPAKIRARIHRGQMHFEDFLGVARSIDENELREDSGLSVPTGYQSIILAMTPQERLSPWLFSKQRARPDGAGNGADLPGSATTSKDRTNEAAPSESALASPTDCTAAARISRIAKEARVSEQTVETFVSDFGSIQAFFANAAKSRSKKKAVRALIKDSARSAAKNLASSSRRQRRDMEKQSKLLKDAGAELRAEQAKSSAKVRSGFR